MINQSFLFHRAGFFYFLTFYQGSLFSRCSFQSYIILQPLILNLIKALSLPFEVIAPQPKYIFAQLICPQYHVELLTWLLNFQIEQQVVTYFYNLIDYSLSSCNCDFFLAARPGLLFLMHQNFQLKNFIAKVTFTKIDVLQLLIQLNS